MVCGSSTSQKSLALAVGLGRGAPLHAELVERADEGRPVLAVPGGDLPLEEGRQADGVADDGHPLGRPVAAAAGQLLGLLQREDGLAAAGAAADLDAVEQPGHPQQRGLLLGQPVGLGGPLLGLGDDVEEVGMGPLRISAISSTSSYVGAALAVGEAPGVLREPTGQRTLVTAVVQRPARQVGDLEVVGEGGERGGHAVRPGHAPAAGPAVVALDVLTQRVLRGPRLGDRVDGRVAAVTLDDPAVVPADVAALDLEDEHADLRHEDDEVGLVVLVLVGQPEVGQQHVVVAEGVAQALPDLALGLGREGGVLRDQPWHGADPATTRTPRTGHPHEQAASASSEVQRLAQQLPLAQQHLLLPLVGVAAPPGGEDPPDPAQLALGAAQQRRDRLLVAAADLAHHRGVQRQGVARQLALHELGQRGHRLLAATSRLLDRGGLEGLGHGPDRLVERDAEVRDLVADVDVAERRAVDAQVRQHHGVDERVLHERVAAVEPVHLEQRQRGVADVGGDGRGQVERRERPAPAAPRRRRGRWGRGSRRRSHGGAAGPAAPPGRCRSARAARRASRRSR